MLTQATSRDERHKNPVFRRLDKPWCRTNKIQHLQSLICAYSNETDVFLSIELATCCHAKRKCCSYLWKKGFTGKSASFLNAGILCWPTLHRGISPIHHLSWPCNQSNLISRRLTFWAMCQATHLGCGANINITKQLEKVTVLANEKRKHDIEFLRKQPQATTVISRKCVSKLL